MKKHKEIVIICNGEKPKKNILLKELRESDFLICADGGANHAARLGIIPDIIIGDLDSINEKNLNHFRSIKIIKEASQETTDLEKALNYAMKFKPDIIKIFGATGDRFDHSLSNLSILKKYHKLCYIELICKNYIIRLIDKSIEFFGKIGQTISIIPIGKVSKITTTGLRYALKNEDLEFGVREGQSNIIESNPVKIYFKKGEFFLIINF